MVAFSKNSRWRPKWPPRHIWSIISGNNSDRNMILVYRIGFGGSRYSTKIFLTFSDNHVTFKIQDGVQNGRQDTFSQLSQEITVTSFSDVKAKGFGFEQRSAPTPICRRRRAGPSGTAAAAAHRCIVIGGGGVIH